MRKQPLERKQQQLADNEQKKKKEKMKELRRHETETLKKQEVVISFRDGTTEGPECFWSPVAGSRRKASRGHQSRQHVPDICSSNHD